MSEEQRTQLLDNLILGDQPIIDRTMIALNLPETPTAEVPLVNDQKEETVTAVLDCGSTTNFIDKRIVEQLELPTKKLANPHPIINSDGTENKIGPVTHISVLEVWTGKERHPLKFDIVDSEGKNLVLGFPWFRAFDPRIDWIKRTTIEQIRIRTTPLAWEQWRRNEVNRRKQGLGAQMKPTTTCRDGYLTAKTNTPKDGNLMIAATRTRQTWMPRVARNEPNRGLDTQETSTTRIAPRRAQKTLDQLLEEIAGLATQGQPGQMNRYTTPNRRMGTLETPMTTDRRLGTWKKPTMKPKKDRQYLKNNRRTMRMDARIGHRDYLEGQVEGEESEDKFPLAHFENLLQRFKTTTDEEDRRTLFLELDTTYGSGKALSPKRETTEAPGESADRIANQKAEIDADRQTPRTGAPRAQEQEEVIDDDHGRMTIDRDDADAIPDDSDSAEVALHRMIAEPTSEDPISRFDRILKIFLGSPSAQKPPYAEDIQYHTRRLLTNCTNAFRATNAHDAATWQYPLYLASWLHERQNASPGRATTDIVVPKFKYTKKEEASTDYLATSDPDVISYTPISDQSPNYPGLGSGRCSFHVGCDGNEEWDNGWPPVPEDIDNARQACDGTPA
jgi:hypothetical protein